MAPDKVALQDMSAEQEADALLAEEEARQQGRAPNSGKRINTDGDDDDDAFKNDLADLERSESLPPPAVQPVNAVSLGRVGLAQTRSALAAP